MFYTSAITALLLATAVLCNFNQDTDWNTAQSFHDFSALDLEGNQVSLDKYRGNVVVVFNGATRCPVSAKNFKLLQALQEKYGPEGLRIVTFAVDGLAKESGTNEEIREYVKGIAVSFDVYGKIVSDGDAAHPVYKWMKAQLQDKIPVAAKVLIDKDGKVVAKYPPTGPLTELENTLKQYL